MICESGGCGIEITFREHRPTFLYRQHGDTETTPRNKFLKRVSAGFLVDATKLQFDRLHCPIPLYDNRTESSNAIFLLNPPVSSYERSMGLLNKNGTHDSHITIVRYFSVSSDHSSSSSPLLRNCFVFSVDRFSWLWSNYGRPRKGSEMSSTLYIGMPLFSHKCHRPAREESRPRHLDTCRHHQEFITSEAELAKFSFQPHVGILDLYNFTTTNSSQ